MKVLIAYASKHGATRGIAERLKTTIEAGGADAVLVDVSCSSEAPPVDAAIVGSAVYMGRWTKEATEFVRTNMATLSARPLWLFSSGPVGPQVLPEAKEIAEFGSIPSFRGHHVFSGALDRRGLSFGERVMVRTVKAPEGDSRDWHDVDSWAQAIASEMASAVPSDRPSAVGTAT